MRARTSSSPRPPRGSWRSRDEPGLSPT
jgi:hypothetical protein